MAATISIPTPFPGQRRAMPLANGDRMTRAEFERRCASLPEEVKAELIEGAVYIAPPVRYAFHGNPHAILNWWLVHYILKTPGLPGAGDNASVILDNDNEPQPDLLLMLPPHAGGRAVVDSNGYIAGPPALVCEVSASSVSIDSHGKKSVYRRSGVQEYLVYRTEDGAVDSLMLSEGNYVPIVSEPDGTLRSRAFPGLWLHVPSLLAADLPTLLSTLVAGAAAVEHAEFVQRLRR